ncbi:MAG: hypothetical protein HC875_27620 [Anaerolineales bacterium]|nr:hypothetical protein [Anaerolineales bacterium]
MATVRDKDAVTGTDTTGHEWDGIRELDTPLPRWWLNVFYVTIAFSILWWILYPSWPTLNGYLPGILGDNQRIDLQRRMEAAQAAQAEWIEKIKAADLAAIIDAAGVTVLTLPPSVLDALPDGVVVLDPEGCVEQISAEASRQTGLPTTTLVVNGGHDHCCEALAMGLTPGELMLTCGTAWVITGVMDRPDLATLPASMDLNFHVAPQRWAPSRFWAASGPRSNGGSTGSGKTSNRSRRCRGPTCTRP